MYGQVNYGPQFGPGPQTPMPPANQQRPPAPPPPPLQYQQGPPAPPPPVNQQATSAMPSQIGQRGPYLYQHGFPAPPPLHQSQPILLGGMPNTGQPYLHPPQPVHGSTLVSQCYSNAQHNVQHPSRTGTQNLYRIPPPSLVSPHGPLSCPDMLQAAAPQGALPPPPAAAAATQGPTLYKALYSSQQQTGGAQGFQHIPPPPPPPAPNIFTPTTFGSSVHLTFGDSHMPNMAPLPPPPKPSDGSVMLHLSPPPPKPSDEKIVHKIEFFCQLIAKNGPGIEDVTRQNESKNLEFEFLFGGEPGSGAAVAHEYFLWMKKKCTLACKLHEGKNESPLKSLVIDSSSQPDHFMVSSGCSLLADSDMEMEDDITLSDRDQAVNGSIEALNCKSDLIHEELDVKKQLHGPQSSPEWSTPQGVLCETVSCSLPSELCKQSEGPNLLFDQGWSTIEKSPSRVDNICSTEAAECPLVNDLEKSTIPRADDQNTFSASVAAEAMHSDELSNQSIKVGSSFRLLQDYASDNSSGNDDEVFTEDVNVIIVPPSVTAGAKSSQKDAESHLETYIGSKSPCVTDKVSGPQSESRKSYKAAKFSLDSETQVKDSSTTLITIESHEAFQEKDALGGAGIDIVSKRGKSREGKKAKFESVQPKVDEYGRLVREGSGDSNSDDSRYNKRHNKRGRSRIRSRSRSRSRSPLDRRRRRSPQRRREKRRRSRSWSSRNRRSRSRSPTFRRAGEFRDDNKRQDRRHIPECFDFLRGRCYRGASCRYMHHEYDKNDGSSRHTSKQKDLEFQPSLKNSRIKEEIKPTNLHDDIKGQEMQLCQVVSIATKDGQWIDPDKINCESSRVAAATMQLEQIIEEKPEETTTQIPDKKEFQEVLESHHPSLQLTSGADNMKSCGDTSQDVLLPMKVSIIKQSQSNNPVAKLQKDDCPSQKMEDSLISDSSAVQGSKTSANKVSSSEPLPNTILSTHSWPIKSSNGEPLSSTQFSSQFIAPKESSLPSFSAANIPYSSQLPPPPPLSLVQGASATHVPQLHRKNNLMPPYPIQSTPTGSIHSCQDPLPNQHAQFSLPPDSLWTSLPPPPLQPLYDSSLNAGTSAQGVSSQFQPNNLVPRNDFSSQTYVRPYPTGLPSHSQVGEFLPQMYPPVREHPRPLLHREDYGSGNPSTQPFGGPGLMREDRFTHAPLQDLNSSNSFAHGNIHPQPAPSSRELTMNKMQNFSGDNFPSGELLNSSLQIHTRPPSQQPTYGVQHPVGDSILGMPGKTGVQYAVGDSILGVPGKDGPMSRYPPDLLDRNQLSRLPDFGASRIPTHHNPYAATFEQPLSSKFSSNFLIQEKDASCGNIFGTPFLLSQVPVDGQGVGSVGSRQTTSSPSSARAVGQLLPKSDGEQYDPLFDGIEPSPSLLNNDHGQKHKPTSESKIMVRLSGSCKPLDVEENNKNKEVGTVASATSMDNDEYGETADAEVGVVEDESPSNTDDAANMAAGEIEIDQVESQGKSKKKKDSRSMRLFKTSVADFVKEKLKPSWRQGNMSKEAFKTIVKKTVDKVSGAMKSHQIPKSQAKINHYIESSRRKLTKLVMGYVEKYVKS